MYMCKVSGKELHKGTLLDCAIISDAYFQNRIENAGLYNMVIYTLHHNIANEYMYLLY